MVQTKKRIRGQQGFTLTEVLIASVIGTLIASGLAVAVVSYLRFSVANITAGEVQSEIRNAMDYMAAELKEARYIYREPGTGCPDIPDNPDPIIDVNNCAVDITQNSYTLPSGIGGGAIPVTPLNLGGFQLEAAFWIPAKVGAFGLNTCAPAGVPTGARVSVSTVFPATGGCVTFGNENTLPGYVLVVYYTRTPTAIFLGPRVLYRQQSEVVGISITDFGQGIVDSGTIGVPKNAAVPKGFVTTPPALGGALALADLFADDATIGKPTISVRNIDQTNGQTRLLRFIGSYEGVDSTARLPFSQGDLDRLEYTTTVIARNVCSAGGGSTTGTGDITLCAPDPPSSRAGID